MKKILPILTRLLPCCLAAVVLLATSGMAVAQERTVTGRVISADDGQGFPGANIVVKGTTSGTVTDADGKFSILVPSAESVLVITAIGFATEEVLVGQQTIIDVSITPDITTLTEVVVIGYGTVKKSDVTGALAHVSAEQIQASPVQNTLQALQGRSAGVDVTSVSRPGEVGVIRIRGERSLTATNDPLYVVDGIPLQVGGLENINPSDIESIDILKDASATAIYGSRASNGVVLVTTKSGKSGKAQVSYAGSIYSEKIWDRMEMFNAPEYAEYRRNAYRALTNATKYPTPYPNPVDDKRILGQDPFAWESIAAGYTWIDKANNIPAMRPTTPEEQAKWGVTEVPVYDPSKVPTTNWTDYVNRTGITQDHNVSVTMGTEKVKAFVSGGYLNQKGTSAGQDFKRYSGRVNVEVQAVDWLNVGASMAMTYGIQNYGFAAGGSRGSRTIYEAAKGMLPFAVPYDTAGNYIYMPGADVGIINPIKEDEYVTNERTTLRLMGSFFAEAKLAKGLRFRMNFGPDLKSYQNGQFQTKESSLRGGGAASSTNYASFLNERQLSWTLENLLFYDRSIGAHQFGVTLLQSSSMQNMNNSSMAASNLPYNTQKWYNLGSTSRGALDSWGSAYSKRTLMSYMGRLNYAFNDKYLLTVTGRWDGASVLADGNKWHFFPSAALAWKATDEPFLRDVTWLTELKPRVGIGLTGSQSIAPYTVLGPLVFVPTVFGNVAANGYVNANSKGAANEQGSDPNPALGWEKTKTVNIGMDFGFLENRITGAFEYYIATTSDLLFQQSLPNPNGTPVKTINAGKTESRGIEISLSAIAIDRAGFQWQMDVAFSKSRSEILETALGKVDDVGRGWFVDESFQAIYDYKKIGIWQISDADEMAKFNANGATYKAGDIRVEDVNGDYKIDLNNDRQILGSRLPDWTAGFTNTFRYKGIELSALLYARWGQMIDGGAVDMQGRYASRKVDYWTEDNPTNAYPRADNANGGVPVHYSAMNYNDGSFVKIRYVSLGYTFPQTLIGKTKLSHLKVYVQALNPFLYSKVDFLDPDYLYTGTNISGSPLSSRSFVFGINATF